MGQLAFTVGLKQGRACSFASSYQISSGCGPAPALPASHRRGPSLCAALWHHQSPRLGSGNSKSHGPVCSEEFQSILMDSRLFWSLLFPWQTALLTSGPAPHTGATALQTARPQDRVQSNPYHRALISLRVVLTFWSNPGCFLSTEPLFKSISFFNIFILSNHLNCRLPEICQFIILSVKEKQYSVNTMQIGTQ